MKNTILAVDKMCQGYDKETNIYYCFSLSYMIYDKTEWADYR